MTATISTWPTQLAARRGAAAHVAHVAGEDIDRDDESIAVLAVVVVVVVVVVVENWFLSCQQKY